MGEHLTRSFFETELKDLAQAYGKETDSPKVAVEILLRDGTSVRVEGDPVCTDSYVRFDYKNGTNVRRLVLPYRSIIGVGFTQEGAGVVGFK